MSRLTSEDLRYLRPDERVQYLAASLGDWRNSVPGACCGRTAIDAASPWSPTVAPWTPRDSPDDPWLTIAEAALYARVAPSTVREWIRSGRLPHGRLGRILRVKRSAIDKLLREGAEADMEPATRASGERSGHGAGWAEREAEEILGAARPEEGER